jgi:DNA-binding beta-propeller fold protein YncE
VRRLLIWTALGAGGLGLAATSASAQGAFGLLPGGTGCVAQGTASETSSCSHGHGLSGANAIAASPDGRNVYVTAGTAGTAQGPGYGAVATFSRDASSGVLTQTSCISSDGTDSVDGAIGTCAASGPGLLDADGIAATADGKNVYVAGFTSGSIVQLTRDTGTGALTESGCYQEFPPLGGACGQARVYRNADAAAVTPSGGALFVGSSRGVISSFNLKTLTWGFTPPSDNPNPAHATNPCIATAGVDGACGQGNATQGISSLVVSPDGRFLYAAAPTSSAIVMFAIDSTTGALTQMGCLKHSAPTTACANAKLVNSPAVLAISPDGRSVYDADYSDGARLVTLVRDATTGQLTEGGCVDRLPPPPPPSSGSDTGSDTGSGASVRRAHEAQSSVGCTQVAGLNTLNSVAVAPDGNTVFAAGTGTLNVFGRDPSSGALSAGACQSSDDTRCSTMPAFSLIEGLVSNGSNLYGVATSSSAVLTWGPGAGARVVRRAVDRRGRVLLALTCPRSVRRGCSGRVSLAESVRNRRGRASLAGASSGTRFSVPPGHSRVCTVYVTASVRRQLRRQRTLGLVALIRSDPGHGAGSGTRIALHRR